jgi:hypothetical protein
VNRSWCGRGQYPGLKPFVFGTIVLDAKAKDHEVRQALDDLWFSLIPFSPPDYVPVPGALFFEAEDDD